MFRIILVVAFSALAHCRVVSNSHSSRSIEFSVIESGGKAQNEVLKSGLMSGATTVEIPTDVATGTTTTTTTSDPRLTPVQFMSASLSQDSRDQNLNQDSPIKSLAIPPIPSPTSANAGEKLQYVLYEEQIDERRNALILRAVALLPS